MKVRSPQGELLAMKELSDSFPWTDSLAAAFWPPFAAIAIAVAVIAADAAAANGATAHASHQRMQLDGARVPRCVPKMQPPCGRVGVPPGMLPGRA